MIICHYLLLLIFIASLNRWLSISLFSIFFICWFLKKTFFLNKTRFCVWLLSIYHFSCLSLLNNYLFFYSCIYHFSQSLIIHHYLSLLSIADYPPLFITSHIYHFSQSLIIHHYLSLLSIADYPPLFITSLNRWLSLMWVL